MDKERRREEDKKSKERFNKGKKARFGLTFWLGVFLNNYTIGMCTEDHVLSNPCSCPSVENLCRSLMIK